jgi:hypothetical protein
MAFNKFFKLTYDSFESSGEVKLFHTQKVLDSMGKDWVSRARATLTRKDKNATGALHKSLEYTVTVKNNVITMGLQGEPYGVFVQYGVQGAGPFVPPKNPHPYATKPYINRAPDSPFKFGSGSGGGSISVAIRKWVKDKQLEWRGLDGRFLSYDQMTPIIVRSVFQYGIEPTDFGGYIMPRLVAKYKGRMGLSLAKDIANHMNKDVFPEPLEFEIVI